MFAFSQQHRFFLFVLLLAIIFELGLIYNLFGNSLYVEYFGRSIIRWMMIRWEDYRQWNDFPYVIPVVSLWLVFRDRKKLRIREEPFYPGLLAIAAGIIFHLLGIRTMIPRLSVFSIVFLLWGIPSYIFGRVTGKILFFPCMYLLFCIPLTFLDVFTFPLRRITALIAVFILNGIGMKFAIYGTGIYSISDNSIRLDIAHPCSGLSYLISLFALSTVWGYVVHRKFLVQIAISLSAIPVAMLANVVRIVVITLFYSLGMKSIGDGLYHYLSGYIVFITAVVAFTLISIMMKRIEKRKCKIV